MSEINEHVPIKWVQNEQNMEVEKKEKWESKINLCKKENDEENR